MRNCSHHLGIIYSKRNRWTNTCKLLCPDPRILCPAPPPPTPPATEAISLRCPRLGQLALRVLMRNSCFVTACWICKQTSNGYLACVWVLVCNGEWGCRRWRKTKLIMNGKKKSGCHREISYPLANTICLQLKIYSKILDQRLWDHS